MMTRGARRPKSSSKFGNEKTNGYDSKKEARRAQELQLLEKIGAISKLKMQVPYELVPKQDGERAVNYVCDFQYFEDGKVVVEDVKSEFTRKLPLYVLKRKLLLFIHGIRIKEV